MEKWVLIGIVIFISSAFAYTPPIGIPAPPFGIDETVQSLHGSADYKTKTVTGGGDLGSKMPSLSPGDVLVIDSGTYTLNVDEEWTHKGTAANPIIVRGRSSTSKPVIKFQSDGGLGITGSYAIYENLEIDFNGHEGGVYIGGDHISFRSSEAHGAQGSRNTAVYLDGTYNVVYQSKIHDNGPLTGSGDPDYHGMGANGHHHWVLENEIYRNGGDGMQANAGDASVARETHHIYFGKNDAWGNRQGGFWIKFCEDVIVSQNKFHGHRMITDSSSGQGTGFQYGTERAWFIYNEIYDNEEGITIASDGGPGGDGNGQDSYFIGNVIHDIWRQGMVSWETTSRKHAVNNLIYNASVGIDFFNAVSGTELQNNLFANIKGSDIDLDSNKGGTFAYNFCDNGCTMVDAACNNCASGSPSFVNAKGDNFRLLSASAAMDKGTLSNVYQTFQTLYGLSIKVDADGNARPQGSWDMGPYEYTNGACTPDWQCGAWSICANSQQTRSCTDLNGCQAGKQESQACSCIHESDNSPCDGCIMQDELLSFLQKWKNGQATLSSLMGAIMLWTQDC